MGSYCRMYVFSSYHHKKTDPDFWRLSSRQHAAFIPTDNFSREAKKLAKKHRSLKNNLTALGKELIENPNKGTHIGNGVYKIRMAITSKGKGTSGGARIIS